MDRPTKPSGRHAVRLRWDEIITRLSYRFNFLAIRGRTYFAPRDAERDEDLSGFPGRWFLPRDRQQWTICRMRSFVSACAVRTWLVVLGYKMLIHRFDNNVFDVRGGNAGDRSGRYCLGLSLEMRQRDIIAIADSSFGGVSWDHAVARIVIQQAGQEMVRFGFGVISVRPLLGELLLNCIKKLPIHDRWLLAGQDFAFVFDLADIEPVTQQIEQRAAFEGDAAMGHTGCAQSYLCSDVLVFEISHQRVDAAASDLVRRSTL